MRSRTPLRLPVPRVAILHEEIAEDAAPDELDTLVQVEAVEQALRALGHATDRIQFSLDLGAVTERLRTLAPAVVFNLVESGAGEPRLASLAPALLEALDIPFTGNGSGGMRLTGNKLCAKGMLGDAGLPTPEWLTLSDISRDGEVPAGLWLLKPACEEASVGLRWETALTEGAALAVALRACQNRSADHWLAERYIEGRELNVALLQDESGPRVLPIAEIRFLDFPPERPRILDYEAKWNPESFAYRHTPRHFGFDASDAPLLGRLDRIGRACWELFDLRGYARVDFRVDAHGQPWVLEVNANPCLAPDAGFIAAAHEAGMSFEDVVDRLIRAALASRRPTFATETVGSGNRSDFGRDS